jgi:hypothetical protein
LAIHLLAKRSCCHRLQERKKRGEVRDYSDGISPQPIDALQDGVIAKLGGKMARAEEGSETMNATIGARMPREAVRRAKRPDMPISFDCVGGSALPFSAIFTPEGVRPTDYATIFDATPEMSFPFTDLNKRVLAEQYGVHHPMLGVVWSTWGGSVVAQKPYEKAKKEYKDSGMKMRTSRT